MNDYDSPVDFGLRHFTSYKDERRRLRRLTDRFWKVKKNYVVKARYVQLKMRHRRMQNLLSILKQNTRVYWPEMFLFIKENGNPTPSFGCCAKTFLDELLAVGCSDTNSVEKILKLYGHYCAEKNNLLDPEEMSAAFTSFTCSIFHPSMCNCDTCNSDNATHFDVDLLGFAMRANDLKYMTALLKYGINELHSASCSELYDPVIDMDGFGVRWLVPLGVPRIIPFEAWEFFYDSISGKERGYRRFLLITNMLRILDIKWCMEKIGSPGLDRLMYPVYTDEQFHECVQCMKSYFRATVEPLISKDDVVQFVSSNPFWRGVPKEILEKVGLDYTYLFPEQSYATYTPRTLKHLCRYTLRKSLTEKKVGVLPELVENLYLPKRIGSYILCEY